MQMNTISLFLSKNKKGLVLISLANVCAFIGWIIADKPFGILINDSNFIFLAFGTFLLSVPLPFCFFYGLRSIFHARHSVLSIVGETLLIIGVLPYFGVYLWGWHLIPIPVLQVLVDTIYMGPRYNTIPFLVFTFQWIGAVGLGTMLMGLVYEIVLHKNTWISEKK
jgi:hypothetical protein